MPHDRSGNQLAVGDLVAVPCRVARVTTGEEYCNVDLETVHPMFPTQTPSTVTLNARQVEKQDTHAPAPP